ncbi:nucleotidyl transferase AbiEii/AbiGii toxin family protein, partial [bacterium]|nr:nucleotidyl transferase AbiEii/AbiGii toxin family protein [bacterium]
LSNVVGINIDRLLHFRKNLVSIINKSLTYDEKLFLLSIKSGEPDWGLLGLDNIEELPAVKWKLANIKNMDDKKREIRIEMLKKHLKI